MLVPEVWETKTEQQKVCEWRMERLVRAGAGELTAAALATTDHDLHVMLKAYEAGMTDAQAQSVFL